MAKLLKFERHGELGFSETACHNFVNTSMIAASTNTHTSINGLAKLWRNVALRQKKCKSNDRTMPLEP